MKRLTSIAVVVLLLCAGGFAAKAQSGQLKVGLNYNYSMPLGSFKNDLINKNSANGFGGSIQYGINDNWAVGLGLGYQSYHQKYPRALYQLSKTQTVSAVLTNNIEITPIVAKTTFTPLGDKGFIQPYITVGAGGSMINFRQYLGEFSSTTKNSFSFTAQGGAGVKIPFGKFSSSGVNVGADYSYVPYKNQGYDNLSSLNFHAGVFFPLR